MHTAFSRRVVLAGGVAAMAAPALAKAPLGQTQALSVHRMKLGDFEITAILDGFIDLNPAVLQADAEEVKGLLTAAGWPPSPMRVPVNVFLVNTGDKLVLLDAGGAKMLGPTAGRLPQCLAAIGIEPGQIDEVYITHMHGDHLHGTVTPEGGRMFPNAIVRIAKPDLDYWANPEVEAKAPENQKGRFVAAKRAVAAYGTALKPFALGEELIPGIKSIDAAGHSPGHSCFLVQSGSQKLLAIGDTMHIAPVQFPRPEVTVAFDWDAGRARAARLALFDQMAAEGTPIAAVHLPFPGIGRLRKDGKSYLFTPISWQLY